MKNEGQKITVELEKYIQSIIEHALEYEKITKRAIGITGEVGEIKTCKVLSLRLAPYLTLIAPVCHLQ